MAQEYRLEILDRSHGHALGELRRKAYEAKFGERVDASKLSWNPNDLLFLNLGLFERDQLVASLRLSVIESDAEFHRVSLQQAQPGTQYPLVILSRGATLPHLSSRKLHSHLRLCALKLAFAAGPWNVLGTMEAESPRIKQLEDLGYTFKECENQWDGFLKSPNPILLATLDATKLAHAICILEQRLKQSDDHQVSVIHYAFDFERAVHRIKTHSHRVTHERIDFGIDNNAIWSEVRPILERIPRYDRSPSVGGWALQSPAGDSFPPHSGWPIGFTPYNGPGNRGPTWTPRTDAEKKIIDIQSFNRPTEVCTPLLRELLDRLSERGLNPRRARIIRMPAKSSTRWHLDGSPLIYQARVHIPLITNENCYFESEFGKIHMPADGSLYFVHINRPHRAVNEGTADRFHFVAHIWDTQKMTRHHQYDSSLYDRETHHAEDVDMESQITQPAPGTKQSKI